MAGARFQASNNIGWHAPPPRADLEKIVGVLSAIDKGANLAERGVERWNKWSTERDARRKLAAEELDAEIAAEENNSLTDDRLHDQVVEGLGFSREEPVDESIINAYPQEDVYSEDTPFIILDKNLWQAMGN